MIITTIDPSLTAAGVATLAHGQPRALRTAGWAGSDFDTYEQRSERIVAQCRLVLSLVPDDADAIGIEAPAYSSRTGHFFDRAGLWWGIHAGLHARELPIVVVVPTTLKMWATGKGNADKDEVLEATKLRWPDTRIRNHNEADALALAEIVAFKAGDPLPFPIKTRHHNIIKSTGMTWPSAWTAQKAAV